jgi:hypothetical protein
VTIDFHDKSSRLERMTSQRYLVRAAAWLEIFTGVALIIGPQIACQLLFAAPLDGVGVPLGRYAGIAVLALGTACLPSTTAHPRPAVLGLLIYNVAAVVLFVWIWIATTFHGLLLWPAAILHAGIAAGLMSRLRNNGPVLA